MTQQQGDGVVFMQYTQDTDFINQGAYMASQLHSIFMIGLVLIVVMIIGFTVLAVQNRPRHGG